MRKSGIPKPTPATSFPKRFQRYVFPKLADAPGKYNNIRQTNQGYVKVDREKSARILMPPKISFPNVRKTKVHGVDKTL